MKIHQLFENQAKQTEQPLTGSGGRLITTPNIEQLKRWHEKYLFLPCNWWSEYEHECYVAVIVDLPASITDQQLIQLCEAAFRVRDFCTDSTLHFYNDCKNFKNVITKYDPGVSGTDAHGNRIYQVYQYKFCEWATMFLNSLDDNYGDDFDDDLDDNEI